jgi:hypothetical protein
MGMIRIVPVTALAMALCACGEKAAPVEETAQSLSAGLYQLDAEVKTLIATEKLPPATKLKLGDKQQVKACVAADGTPAPELFAEDGDKCEYKDKYIRDGRINAQLSCTRKGIDGQIAPAMNGTFKADSFEGRVTTGTYLYNDGDYQLVRKVTARRIGDCPPEPGKTS